MDIGNVNICEPKSINTTKDKKIFLSLYRKISICVIQLIFQLYSKEIENLNNVSIIFKNQSLYCA